MCFPPNQGLVHDASRPLVIRKGPRPAFPFVMISVLLVLPLRTTASAGPDYIVLTGGSAEILSARKVPVFGAEYRFKENLHGIHPYVLYGWATDGGTYAGVGLLYYFTLSPRWRVTVSSGPGYYRRHRSARDLGHTLEFFSNLELSTRIYRGHWLGLSFGHVSNGGLNRDNNPGSETLRLAYAIPLR